jgi:ectoine hydroxylase-related dioxygenase (phytanoyl-CoA dioxygenase family)
MLDAIDRATPVFDRSALLDHYRRDGFCIVPSLVPADMCQKAIDVSMTLEEAVTGRYKPILQVHLQDPYYYNFLRFRPIVDLMRHMIGEPVVGLQTMFYYCQSGTDGFVLHQDNYCVEAPNDDFASCWVALTDVAPENGAVVVYPGSHKEGSLPVEKMSSTDISDDYSNILDRTICPPQYQPLTVSVKRGDALFLHGDIVHRSLKNTSDKFRFAHLGTYLRRGSPFRPGNSARRYEIDL